MTGVTVLLLEVKSNSVNHHAGIFKLKKVRWLLIFEAQGLNLELYLGTRIGCILNQIYLSDTQKYKSWYIENNQLSFDLLIDKHKRFNLIHSVYVLFFLVNT